MAKIKNLNAPKKATWTVSLFVTIAGLILGVVGILGTGWATIAGLALLLVSSVLMLLSGYCKGL